MKKFLKNFINYFFGNPIFPFIVIVCSVFIVFVMYDSPEAPKEVPTGVEFKIEALKHAMSTTTTTTTSTTSATSTSSSTTTTTTAATTTTTTTVTDAIVTEYEEESFEDIEYTTPSYSYIPAGDSPNSVFYQDRLVIIGDSIAYGFNAYGYVPYQHNISAESLAVWNMHNYSFDVGGGAMGVYDAAAYVYSPLYMIMVGMNDIFTYTADDLAWKIRGIAEEILARVPTATVVVAGITPVSYGNYYTDNDRIREFNGSIEWVINDMQTSQAIYFNTHDVLCDWNTGSLGCDYAGGDGLHLNSSAYSAMLNYLFNRLDEACVYDQIIYHEN